MRKLCFAAAVASLAFAGAAQASTVFEEDFSGDLAAIGGGSPLNFNGFDQFTVSGGSVDIIPSGSYGITCATGGACVDLDGSTSNAGQLTSIQLTFLAGQNYNLTASLSGSQRGNNDETGTFGVTGGIFTATYSVNSNGFSDFSGNFTVAADTSGSIFFQDNGNDNIGAILDNVRLSIVPLPASALMLLGGLGGLAAMRRRRKA